MSTSQTRRRLAFAEGVGREAGQLALEYFRDRDRLGTTMKGYQDFLTVADTAVERLLRQRVAEVFPGDGFLGEEDGGETTAERLWVVDPIDGTANFARGEPYWCVSIGYLEQGRAMLGVTAMPVLGEMFSAARGQGATLNGRPIRVAPTTDMRTAAVEIGWSPRRPVASYIRLIEQVMGLGATIKRSASGALGLCWVASGRTDAYLELHINSWDVAAGVLIAAEAGAVTSDFFAGEGLTRGNPVLAATPAVAAPLADAMGLDRRLLHLAHAPSCALTT